MIKKLIVKDYDKTLRLYLDFVETLKEYRLSIKRSLIRNKVSKSVLSRELNKIKKTHNDLLTRLRLRLNIQSLYCIVNNHI